MRDGGNEPNKPAAKDAKSLRMAILGAFEDAGGQAYLLGLAKTEPKTFCALLGKILPTQIEPTEGGEIQMVFSWLQGTGRDVASNLDDTDDNPSPAVNDLETDSDDVLARAKAILSERTI